MRTWGRKDLVRWYKQLWDFKPESDDTERDVRFGLAFALVQFHDNFQTAAHVLIDQNWDGAPAERVALVAAADELKAGAEECKTQEQFEVKFAHLYNQATEGAEDD